MITPKNIVRHEFIGLEVKVEKSKDKGKKGLRGEVFDETRKTLKIDTGEKEVMIPKEESEFEFVLPEGERVEVKGKVIVGRPEERIKKRFPRKWEYSE